MVVRVGNGVTEEVPGWNLNEGGHYVERRQYRRQGGPEENARPCEKERGARTLTGGP